MNAERERYIRNLDSLAPLSDHTDAIHVNTEGRVEIARKLAPPNDEFGIPRPEIMVEQLLSEMATSNYVWSGRFDEHHLATPKADFTVVRTHHEGDIGSAFRGLSCLKVELPRQMHNFSHAIFELPGRPSLDVMRQAVMEIGQAKQLQAIINEHFPDRLHGNGDRASQLCVTALHAALERMQEPQVGMLPELSVLADMELDDLRRSVNALIRIRRFSDKKLVHPAIRGAAKYRHHLTRQLKMAA